jgi:hypothetical protein
MSSSSARKSHSTILMSFPALCISRFNISYVNRISGTVVAGLSKIERMSGVYCVLLWLQRRGISTFAIFITSFIQIYNFVRLKPKIVQIHGCLVLQNRRWFIVCSVSRLLSPKRLFSHKDVVQPRWSDDKNVQPTHVCLFLFSKSTRKVLMSCSSLVQPKKTEVTRRDSLSSSRKRHSTHSHVSLLVRQP